VIVAGVIVDDPAAALMNYSGSGGPAVCGLFAKVLAKAPPSEEQPTPED
jgi:hypothetical protein